MLRWQFLEPVVETSENVLHRPGCPKIDNDELVEHAAESTVDRDVAPSKCGACRPNVVMQLGRITRSPPLEETDDGRAESHSAP